MTLNFHLKQTPEYTRLQVQYNIQLEVKIQALMKIERCFTNTNFSNMNRLWHLWLDKHPNYQTQYVILIPQIQILTNFNHRY